MQATEFLAIDASERAQALGAWIDRQPDKAVYADQLALELQAMESVPFKAKTGNGDTQLICFLEAEGMRHPLADLAQAGSPATRAILLAHASTSASVTGDLADIGYVLAREAVVIDPSCQAAVQAFEDSLYGYTDEVFDDILGWHLERPDVARMALAIVHKVRDSWSPEHVQRLVELEALLA